MYDLAGLIKPYEDKNNQQKAMYAPVDIFPLDTDTPKINSETGKEYDGWILFLDEFNLADKYTLAAAYKLLHDRMIGQHKLHPNVRIICAGNRAMDSNNVQKLPSPIQSRLIHINLEIDNVQWLEWLADQTDWNQLIYPFLNFRTNLVNNYTPSVAKKENAAFACPRSWELLSKQLNSKLLELSPSTILAVCLGTVGEEAGSEFFNFINIISKLPSAAEIEKDPINAPLPASTGAQFAIGTYLSNFINKGNEFAFLSYINRIYENDIKLVVCKNLFNAYPAIAVNNDFITLVKTLQGMSNGTSTK